MLPFHVSLPNQAQAPAHAGRSAEAPAREAAAGENGLFRLGKQCDRKKDNCLKGLNMASGKASSHAQSILGGLIASA